MRYLDKWAVGLTAALLSLCVNAQTLVVGDQSYSSQSVMEAAGVLKDLPYTLEWKQFTAGSPVAEALNAGSLDIGLLGDAPPLFLGALGAPIKVIAVTRQDLAGVAILVRQDSAIHSLADFCAASGLPREGFLEPATAADRPGQGGCAARLRGPSLPQCAGCFPRIGRRFGGRHRDREPYVTQQVRQARGYWLRLTG